MKPVMGAVVLALYVLGAVLIVAGVSWIHRPTGIIVGGVFILYLGWAILDGLREDGRRP